MAVVLSLLVILPALAENTDGQVYQGRTLSDELVVAVFENALDSRGTDQAGLGLATPTRAYMIGANAANPRDTFFNGKLYVSNQAKAFNTVLVTHLGPDPAQCVSVEVRNNNTGSKITLSLVPSSTTPQTVDLADTRTGRYYQNYFEVVDRDGTEQVENHNGMLTCEVPTDGTVAAPITDGTIATDGDDADTEADESLARINASDGDKLTVRAGTHIQEIYVDGEAPTFSEVTLGDGDRFKSAELRIGFEVRDGGAGLRHDGENVISIDGDAVLHDAANATNTEPNVFGDNDGITDREPISEEGGGSADIDVTFYTPTQVTAKEAAEAARKAATEARADATAARAKADAAAAAAVAAANKAAGDPLDDDDGGAAGAADTAAAAARNGTDRGTADTELGTAAAALRIAAGVLRQAANTAPDAADVTTATNAAKVATDAAAVADTHTADVKALEAAAAALTATVTAMNDQNGAGGALTLANAADTAGGAADTAEGLADTAERVDAAQGTPIDDHGSSGWTQVARGTAYKANIVYYITDQLTNVLEYQWMVSAKDRVGNKGEANSKKRFDLTIDTVAPQVSVARTGISYDVDKNKEVRNRNYIALTFTNDDGGAEDPIATSTLDVRDFIVEGFEVVDIIHPELLDDAKADGKYKVKDAEGIDDSSDSAFDDIGARDPRSRVYLELDSELGSAEKPRIQILGGAVTDLAGNQNSPPQQLNSIDKIPAGLTIAVESSDSSSGRTVATDDGTFTVTVDADEPLKRTPRVYFAPFEVTASHDENTGLNEVEAGETLARLTLNDDVTVSPVAEEPAPALDVIERGLAWTQDYDADSTSIFGADSSVYVVLIWSEDLGGNAGSSSGWKSTAGGVLSSGDTLDLVALDDAGLLIEIDRSLEPADAVVLPSTDDDLVTESSNPYLQLIFGEAAENTAAITFVGVTAVEASVEGATPVVEAVTGIDTVTATFKSVKDDTDTVALDAHKKVTLTAVTLDGTDVSASVGPGLSTTEDKFVIALRNLSAGEHTLTYSAVDEAGNVQTDVEVEFEVKARAAYKVAIRPGWNLISLPGTPVDNSIGDVMAGNPDTGIVLGYQNGAWVSAIRNDAGEWLGTLTDIVGGYGYWVQTTVFEAISATIPSADPTDVLPTVPVIAGWNLLGIVDISQGTAGSQPIGKEEADDYFVSIDWRVGYYFNNESNDWQKIVPDAEPSDGGKEILNGKGYWIWSIRPGKLVP